jgi:hypothetical protein
MKPISHLFFSSLPRGFDSWQEQEFFFQNIQTISGLAQSPIQLVPAIFPSGKVSRCETDHSPPYSTSVLNQTPMQLVPEVFPSGKVSRYDTDHFPTYSTSELTEPPIQLAPWFFPTGNTAGVKLTTCFHKAPLN